MPRHESDDQNARKARAKQLQKEIEALTSVEGARPAPAKTAEKPHESPRDFIHRKMAELDEAEGSRRDDG
jgi:hypothetical protein